MSERPTPPEHNCFDLALWRRSQRLSFRAQKRKILEAKQTQRPRLTKLQKIELALRHPGGASLAELRRLTGWQAHSVRGAISGWLKKKKGLAIISERDNQGRRYLISDRPPMAVRPAVNG